jgi:two-component system, response regulator FlrC
MPNILVVEDDEASRVGLLVLLADAGYRALGAGTLKEARRLMEEEHPDFVIVDVRLDGDNGLQLLAMASRPVPAIVMTGFSDSILQDEARQLGADFMVKPIAPKALLECIQRTLSSTTADASYGGARRWPRRQLAGTVAARVEQAAARIIDVGYGGVRLEVQSTEPVELPSSPRLTLSDNVSVPVNVVWQRKSGADTWLYGMAVDDEHRSAWRELVDTLSS